MQKGEEQAIYKSDLYPFNSRSENLSISQSYRRTSKAGEIPQGGGQQDFPEYEPNNVANTLSRLPPTPWHGGEGESLRGRGTGAWPHALEGGTLGCTHTKGSKAKPISSQ